MNDERLQRVTAPGYLADLHAADAARIRAMRDECRAEERRLSYVRRVVQGHLDLALAEIDRRRAGEEPSSLVTRVTTVLTGAEGGGRSARAVGLYQPSGPDEDEAVDLETARLPHSAEVLGPVPVDEDTERVLVRVPRTDGKALATALAAAQAARVARKAPDPIRVHLDPTPLL